MNGADLLDRGLNELRWPGNRSLLRAYLAELTTWNDRLGLVSVADADELVVRHVLDSLAPWKILADFHPESMADLGSGAGFPGLPLALTFPELAVDLVERMERRANFLEQTLMLLKRTDVGVVQRTFEEVKNTYDLVTFRAVFPLEAKLVKKLRRLLNAGGRIAAYKGRREVIDDELAGLGDLADGVDVVPVKVPFLDEQRHLVILRGPSG